MYAGKKNGFTLMELLVVLSIIGVLAGFLMPVLRETRTKAKITRAKSEIMQIETALRSYYADHRSWSGVGAAGETRLTQASFVNVMRGQGAGGGIPYLELSDRNLVNGQMVDPWGNVYHFSLGSADNVCADNKGAMELYRVCAVWSYGPDGRPDSSENEDDVLSWK